MIVLVILIVLLLNAVFKVYKKQDMTRDNLAKAATSLESLRAREEMLSSEIAKLKTEDGIEAEIREKYGLVKEGEEVIVVVDNDKATSSNNRRDGMGFWQAVLDWLR